jgi:hypothetical protein
MKRETKLEIGLVLTILLCLFLGVKYGNEGNKRIKLEEIVVENQIIIDSLHDELFNTNVELSRHELTMDTILKKYPKINKEYEEYYNHETE